MVCQIMLFSIQRPSVVNEGAESADNKLNGMVSAVSTSGRRKCGDDVIRPSAHRYMAYLKPDQHDPFLNALGNKSSQFDYNLDQPVLAYKRWCRDTLYNI